MGSSIYSSPFFHTVYYFRTQFNPVNWDEERLIEGLFFDALGIRRPINLENFPFNQNVVCNTAANGTFMRLNGCSHLKLHAWVLHPSDRTVKKVVQCAAFILGLPLAAAADLVTNIALLALKAIAWPFLRCAFKSDPLSKRCLNANVCWQFEAVGHSIAKVVLSCLSSLVCCFKGREKAAEYDSTLWGFKAHHFQGENIPPPLLGNLIGREARYRALIGHYGQWFQSEVVPILDMERVQYLQNHCGWEDVPKDQFLEMGVGFLGLDQSKVAFHLEPNRLTLVIDGVIHQTVGGRIYTHPFIRFREFGL